MITEGAGFYVTGGTLGQDAPCYIERRADRDLHEALLRGEFCYVLTARQMGKSSLMVHTAARLRQEGIAVLLLDLQRVGQNLSVEQWYDGLLSLMGQQLDLEDELEAFWLAHPRLGPLQRWMATLQEVVLPRCPGRIVIFVDEIDAVRALPFPADEFFAGIRECYNRRTQDPEYHRLTFCLLGVAAPADLITDTRTSPFNIGRRIEVTDFTEAEAVPLASGLLIYPSQAERGAGRNLPRPSPSSPGKGRLTRPEGIEARGDTDELLRRILHWTGGHPYLTQRLCRAVSEHSSQPGIEHPVHSTTVVDDLCESLFLTRQAREADDNLVFVRNRLLRSEVDLASLLDLYQQMRRGKRVADDETNPLATLLKLSGAARSVGGVLRVRNRIYERVFDREWVESHMPDAERRRQRAAYRRGLSRASALAAIVLAVVGALAFTAASQAKRARRGEQQARLQTALATTSAKEARQRGTEARRLASRLQTALDDRGDALRRLQRSLKTEQEERLRTNAAAREARAAQARERTQRLQTETARSEADAQRRGSDRSARIARRNLYFANMTLAPQDWESHNIVRLRQLLEETRDSPERGFEWAFWQRLCHLELRTFFGHRRRISSVAFSPDGRLLATGSWDRAVKVRDLTGHDRFTLKGHRGPINSVAFSSDGRRLVTASADRTAKIWDAADGRELLTLHGHVDGVSAAAFSPDHRRVATASYDRTARVWDAATGRTILVVQGTSYDLTSVAFSPDGRRLATSSLDATKLWDAATGREMLTLQGVIRSEEAYAFSSVFSPDGRFIVSAGGNRTVPVFDATTGRLIRALSGHKGLSAAAAFSPDSRRIVTGSEDGTARVWDAATGAALLTLQGHQSAVSSVAFAPDGRHILTGSWDGTAKLWDATGDRVTLRLHGHPGVVRSVAFSPDGRRIVTAGRADSTAKVWSVGGGPPLLTLRGHEAPVWGAAFSPDGRRIATGSLDHTARLWDAATGRPLRVLRGHSSWLTAITFSPDGRRIATGGFDGTVKIWDAVTGRVGRTLRGPAYPITAVTVSPDGRRIFTVGTDLTAKIWDVATGREISSLTGQAAPVSSAAFSPKGDRVVTEGTGGALEIRDVSTGRRIRRLQEHRGRVRAVAFSGDGRRIVTGSDEGVVQLWDVAGGRETLTLQGPPGDIWCVAFSPDSRRIAAGTDGSALVWETATPSQTVAWAAPERAVARERRALAAQEQARDALQLVASTSAEAIRLQWQPAPNTAGYRLWRRTTHDNKFRPRTNVGHWSLVVGRQVETSFTDRLPGSRNGRSVTYAVAPLERTGERVAEGRRVTLQVAPASPPPGWVGSSMLEGARSGSVALGATTRAITLRAFGGPFGGNVDGCYFLNQSIVGDFRITVRMPTVPETAGPFALGGLMLRETLDPGARRVYLCGTSSRMLFLNWRPIARTATSGRVALASTDLSLPITLRLVRRGNAIRAEYSRDGGQNFQSAGDPIRFDPPLGKKLYMGLAALSADPEEVATARFQNMVIEKLQP